MKTSIVILTHNHLNVTQLCIESIRKYTEPNTYELIVVDNASTDGTVQWLSQQQDIRCIFNNQNKGFPVGCNQGAKIATGDNIMYLNNDVVVTEGWLENLLKCLYSQEDIGAVGPVTNNCSYYQTIPVNYQNLDEMQAFAKSYNKSDSTLWEERLKLIGYAFLFKRMVYDQVGELDEIFSPGNFEDDDFSVRIRQAGYKLLLSKDTFIHHFGSVSFKESPIQYQNLLKRNEERFVQKWGFDSQKSMLIRYEVLPHVHHTKDDTFTLLEVGSGCGGTLLALKNIFPKSKLFGYDREKNAITQAGSFAQTATGEWETFDLEYRIEKFDYIVINNVLEKVADPEAFLQKVKKLLKCDGILILISKNLTHIKVVESLKRGISPFATDENRYYTLNELAGFLQGAGFSQVIYSSQPTWISQTEQDLIKQLNASGDAEMEQYYQSYEFVLRVSSNESVDLLKEVLEGLKREDNVEIHLERLRQYGVDTVMNQVITEEEDAVESLNLLAVKNFEYGYYEDVIPYLQKAYELDDQNQDTLHNLVAVMEFSGETELAEWYLRRIEKLSNSKSEVVLETWDRQQLKFTLRRIEFGVQTDEALEVLLAALQEGKVTSDEIVDVINRDIIHKVETLNLLAGSFYQNGLHEDVIPLLQKAFEIDRSNQHTLYNLGYVLHSYGEDAMAISFLECIEHPDDMVLALTAEIKGVSTK